VVLVEALQEAPEAPTEGLVDLLIQTVQVQRPTAGPVVAAPAAVRLEAEQLVATAVQAS
jgi:hypothetical protein